jgi:hypothetical protein
MSAPIAKRRAELHGLDLLVVDRGVHDAAIQKLERLRGHRLTYVDASSLVLIGTHRIGEIWGTDRDLARVFFSVSSPCAASRPLVPSSHKL